jgi:hypothetical protein
MKPTQLPTISVTSVTSALRTFTISKSPSDSINTAFRVMLNDGVVRECASGSIAMDVYGEVGDGGFDVELADRSASRYYFVYLIPASRDDTTLSGIMSQRAPSLGPIGYATHRYIGTVKVDASHYVLYQQSAAGWFIYGVRNAGTILLVTGPYAHAAIDDQWNSFAADDAAYPTEVCSSLLVKSVSWPHYSYYSAECYLRSTKTAYAGSPVSDSSTRATQSTSSATGKYNYGTSILPIYGDTMKYWIDGGHDNRAIYVMGYRDKYLQT